jgi:hemerythrin-like domain-containing protein
LRATEILMEEHRIIERVLDALEAALGRIGTSDKVGPRFFLDAASFIRNFADAFHHMKEEDVLFEALAANGMPKQAGPIGVMLYEHEQGRRFTQGLHAAAERWSGGDDDARADVVANGQAYVDLLRQHIMKEDGILFPMAAQFLSPAEQERVLADFARVEKDRAEPGARDKSLALAADLEVRARG